MTNTHSIYVHMFIQQQNHACNVSKLFIILINITSCFNAHVNAIFTDMFKNMKLTFVKMK